MRTKQCDHLSVGVIIEKGDQVALLRRAKFPIAIAPPAGHIDDHGTPEQAAIDEVYEEIGLEIAPDKLRKTAITNRRVDNLCRRIGGDHHTWWVFRVQNVEGQLKPSPDETQGAEWYSPEQLQHLAERTKQLQAGSLSEEDWQREPGLEPVWLDFLTELGYIKLQADV